MEEKNKIKTTTLCQTGGKMMNNRFINEDFVRTGDGYSFLMDGATGLGGPKSICGLTGAEWYVQLVAKFLDKELRNKNKDTKTIVMQTIEYANKMIRDYENANNMKFESFAEPSSSLVICRDVKRNGIDYTQIYELGDSCAVIQYKDGTIRKIDNPNEKRLKALDDSVLKRMTEIAKSNGINVIDARDYPEIQTMLQVNRSKKNTDSGYWVLGTSQEAVEHGVLFEEPSSNIKKVIMYSDGFNYSMLGLTIEDVFEQCKTKQELEILQRRIREAEEKDKTANKQARFKKGDDMSIVVIDRQPILEMNKPKENERL